MSRIRKADIISKDLLKAVLNLESVQAITIRHHKTNILEYSNIVVWANNIPEPIVISLYEFIFKCKEWARDNGKLLTTLYYEDSVIVYVNFKHTLDLSNRDKKGVIEHYDGLLRSDTEYKAIILVCNNILKTKSN